MMFWEKKFNQWIARMRHQAVLPLRVILWNGLHVDLAEATPEVTVRLPGPSSLTYLLNPSLENLAGAYVEGKLHVEGRLQSVIEMANTLAEKSFSSTGRLGQLFRPLSHSRSQDKQAIEYHYDVSNDFYQAFLDPAMVYSCAYFEQGNESLATAQEKKIDHILRKIAVKPGDRLLDIGCGWGALLIRAAEKFGAQCTGITLSENQYTLANQRVADAGLSEKIQIHLMDYRDVTGKFDRITSVGMFEHVGLKNLPEYFAKIASCLTDDGLALNHGITTTNTDHSTARYGAGEFIEQYVFPKGELPHIGRVLTALQEGGLEAYDVENLRRHYAQTCALWAENFENNSTQIHALIDERRFRIWRIYLAGCAHAFSNDWISLYQIVCSKAGRDADTQPWSRRYMYPRLDSH